MGNDINFIDLFAGIGGFHSGLSNAGFKCNFACDIDEECKQTYKKNYNLIPRGDIKEIPLNEIPKHSILCGGFPCQPFSISGKQKGFKDDRGNLFFDIAKIIKSKNPEVIFLENVAHLKNHDKGQTLKKIISILEDDLNYKVSWQILNAKDFGVPQNRERIIIIGNKHKKFDFTKLNKKQGVILKDILDKEGKFQYLTPDEYTLIDKKHIKKQKSGLIFVGYRNKTIRKKGARPNTEHLSRVHKQPNRIYSSDGTHPTIPSQETAGRFFILHNNKVRKLTINECFKLMGFPENFIKVSANGKLYNQIGNSVCVPMIEEVGKQIKEQFFNN